MLYTNHVFWPTAASPKLFNKSYNLKHLSNGAHPTGKYRLWDERHFFYIKFLMKIFITFGENNEFI